MLFGPFAVRQALLLGAAVVLFSGQAALAGCNCSKLLGSCNGRAKVWYSASDHAAKASGPKCALVTFYMNDTPGSITITGVDDIQPWGGEGVPAISGDDCSLCAPDDAAGLSGPGPGGIKIDVNPVGRTSPDLKDVHKDALKLLRPGS
jgi:hypothetical protein